VRGRGSAHDCAPQSCRAAPYASPLRPQWLKLGWQEIWTPGSVLKASSGPENPENPKTLWGGGHGGWSLGVVGG
jgi:hypothetical protein